jgi:hypothetical protein
MTAMLAQVPLPWLPAWMAGTCATAARSAQHGARRIPHSAGCTVERG